MSKDQSIRSINTTPRTTRTPDHQRTEKNDSGSGAGKISEAGRIYNLIEEALEAQNDFDDSKNHLTPYQGPLWTFVWWIKGDPTFRDLSAIEAFDICTDCLESLDESHPLDPWIYWMPFDDRILDADDAEEAFVNAWTRVIWPRGYDPVYRAVREGNPIPIEGETAQFAKVLGTLASLASFASTNDQFFVSQAKLADLLGFTRQSTCQIIGRICRRGFLQQITRGSSTSGRASEYVLHRSKLPNRVSGQLVTITERTA